MAKKIPWSKVVWFRLDRDGYHWTCDLLEFYHFRSPGYPTMAAALAAVRSSEEARRGEVTHYKCPSSGRLRRL